MTALASKLGLLRPLARSRLVGALVEKLPSFRSSAAMEDPRFLQVQRCSDAWEERTHFRALFMYIMLYIMYIYILCIYKAYIV